MKTFRKKLNLGFYLNTPLLSYTSSGATVGDELYAETCAKTLRMLGHSATTYGPNYLPKNKIDVMIYMNEKQPNKKWSNKHIFYLQNPYPEGSDVVLKRVISYGFNGYMFISEPLRKLHNKAGLSGIYLPFGVDTTAFFPREISKFYQCDISFVGNNFKGEKRAIKYLVPATFFNFSLFGRWWGEQNFSPICGISSKRINILRLHLRNLLNRTSMSYFDRLYTCYKGKLPKDDLPILYSNSKIVLNYTHEDNVKWSVTTLRIYEALACGALVISDFVGKYDGKISNFVYVTEGDDDEKKIISHCLNNPQELQTIQSKASKYIKDYHSIRRRMYTMLSYIETII